MNERAIEPLQRPVDEAIEEVFAELRRAERLHPGWPEDVMHGAANVAEEALELIQAAADLQYHGGSVEQVRKEAVHTTAVGLRFLINMARGGNEAGE